MTPRATVALLFAALGVAVVAAAIFLRMIDLLEQRGVRPLGDAVAAAAVLIHKISGAPAPGKATPAWHR